MQTSKVVFNEVVESMVHMTPYGFASICHYLEMWCDVILSGSRPMKKVWVSQGLCGSIVTGAKYRGEFYYFFLIRDQNCYTLKVRGLKVRLS